MKEKNRQLQLLQMFTKIFVLCIFILSSISTLAQCYKSNLDVGKQQYNSGKYQTALATFEKSLKCPDAKGGAEAKPMDKKMQK